MTTRRKALRIGAVVAASVLALSSCGGSSDSADTTVATDTSAATQDHVGPHVVVSTSWIGAFAQLAGATDITVIAPSNLQHPPDYDPKASDLAAVADADFVLLAGFEGFAQRLMDAAGSDAKVEKIATEYYPEALTKEVSRLAALMGLDVADAEHNASHYGEHFMEEMARVKSALGDAQPVVVSHMYTGVWAMLAGLEPVATFGPKPMTATEVKSIANKKPTLIIENSHMPAGTDLSEVTGAVKVDAVNFPGDDMDLDAVVTRNADLLIEAFASLK